MTASLASAITKAASKQTWYTVRWLVDAPRREDAFRAYAYFRWVDDILDAEVASRSQETATDWRGAFLLSQQRLLEECLRGETPQGVNSYEAMLVELMQHAEGAVGLQAYLRNMMQVMAFDVGRRGRLISNGELEEYTRSLAVAVTEVMHHFIGNGMAAPHDETRYAAATGAHILHMLRDTYPDLRTGYYNVPQEMLAANAIGPTDVDNPAYRAWIQSRVRLAGAQLEAGKQYFARVECRRHRLAGLAYILRFEWLVQTLARDGYRIRPDYSRRRDIGTDLRSAWRLFTAVSRPEGVRSDERNATAQRARA